MKLQQLLSYTRRAVDDYGMISPNDKIAVGISGGKDSLTLLYALSGLKRFYPNPFTIEAITAAVFKDMNYDPVKRLCEELQVNYTIIPTDIGDIVFEQRKEENPCSLCAKMRKGAFNEQAKALGCNKVAYAHHKDDIVETMLMSLIYEGRFHSFSPYTYLDRMDLTVIRPLMYVTEADVIGFRNRYHLPVCKNSCPADGHTKREYAKELVRKLSMENPGAKERIFTAIVNGRIPGWPEKQESFAGKKKNS